MVISPRFQFADCHAAIHFAEVWKQALPLPLLLPDLGRSLDDEFQLVVQLGGRLVQQAQEPS